MRITRAWGMTLILAMLVAGCGDDSVQGPALQTSEHWQVQFITSGPAGPSVDDGEAQRQGYAFPSAPDSVVITGGGIVIRSLRLADDLGEADTVITAADESRDSEDSDIRFKGPYELAFNGDGGDLGTVAIPTGSYRRVVFVVQPAENDGSGDLGGSSIVVSGTVWRNGRGSRFVFSSDYASEFSAPANCTVGAGETVNGVLTLAAKNWFRGEARWFDPLDPADRGAILQKVRQNISVSLTVE
jgi:hypothetical protein